MCTFLIVKTLDGRFTVRLFIGILLILPIFCASQVAGHGHHGQSNVHTQERPSLKYTKEVNEPKLEDNQHVHETSSIEAKHVTITTWLQALCSKICISLTSLIIPFFIPINNTPIGHL